MFVEHIPFFSLCPANHPTPASYLPHFPESQSPPVITKVYVCQPPPLPPATPGPEHLPFLAPAPGKDAPDPFPLRRSSRLSKPPDRYSFFVRTNHPIDPVPISTSYS